VFLTLKITELFLVHVSHYVSWQAEVLLQVIHTSYTTYMTSPYISFLLNFPPVISSSSPRQ